MLHTRTIISSKTTPMPVIQATYELVFSGQDTPTQTEYHPQLQAATYQAVELGGVFETNQHIENWLKFQGLVVQWRAERGAMSSITEAVLCPAYQGIIGLGPDATLLLLAQLRDEGDEPDQWFWALKSVTGADPVRPEDRGNYTSMAAAWLEWGQRQGYAW